MKLPSMKLTTIFLLSFHPLWIGYEDYFTILDLRLLTLAIVVLTSIGKFGKAMLMFIDSYLLSNVKAKSKVCGVTIYSFDNFEIATNGKVSFIVTSRNPYLV